MPVHYSATGPEGPRRRRDRLRNRAARFRSAITGRFVKRTTAERHPSTTVRERRDD